MGHNLFADSQRNLSGLVRRVYVVFGLEAYEAAIDAYLSKRFDTARSKFDLSLTFRPADPAARMLLDRIRDLDVRRLPEDWDGSVAFTTK